jgi:hypothetical protein
MVNRPSESTDGKVERAALSRQLAEFLIELSIALHKHAMYPDGHPSLAPAATQVVERLHRLHNERATLSLGVARTRLVIEGVATDPKNPVLRDLASRLHRHQLGAVTFKRGIDVAELRDFLRGVAIEPDRAGEPLGTSTTETHSRWPNIGLHGLGYDRLRMVGSEGEEEEPSANRAEQLWLRLAQAALASDESAEATDADPSVVARAIDQHARGTAYDQVIVGYLLQLAEELRTAGGNEAIALKQRMSELIERLDSTTLGNLLAMGGDRDQRRQFMLNASQALTADAVLEIVRAASSADEREQPISHSLLRMLQKLARHAEAGQPGRRTQADSAIRDQVQELIRDWSLRDPNPESYRRGLETMAGAAPAFAAATEARYPVEPKRIFQMAVEADATGDLVNSAVHTLISRGDLSWVLESLSDVKAVNLSTAVQTQVAAPETLERVLTKEPLDAAALDLLLHRIGTGGAEPMMSALIASESSQTRRVLLDRLVRLGGPVGELAVRHLDDPRWFVQRNMLVILSALPERPVGFNAADFLQHADSRVRREAIRILLAEPLRRERAICHAVADGDARTVRLGLSAAIERCPETAVSLVVSRTTAENPRDIRLLAIKALGACGNRVGLETLLRLVAPRRRLFRSKAPSRTPEYLAAIAALHQYAEHPGARHALAEAAKSSDPEVVRAAVGNSPPAGP